MLAALAILVALAARAAAAPAPVLAAPGAGDGQATELYEDAVTDDEDEDAGEDENQDHDDDDHDDHGETVPAAEPDADLAAGQLPELAGFAAGPDRADDLTNRRGTPIGRLEVSIAWLRMQRLDAMFLVATWRR